ncbi:gamma subclass chorismate mutase AroQ [Glaciimonas sp. Cout2]|uniref:gamma subclass chorismate mutase AroQ n=1 Tax=Glaciimonas sp. Cout2 TaxID=3048621 RepID=UPI002B22C293|nr:gamma subclass chorismate mutase AroQ [Glaciimonas sp. Cout2]MEB0010619.1 gamma subclass chorismate mutase AroQ [Glaciimonas sp. Cout2]
MLTPCLTRSCLRRLSCLAFVLMLAACQSLLSTTPDAVEQQQTIMSSADAQKIDYLLGLIDQRLSIASKVAKSKWNSGAAVDDAKRERQILEVVTAQADAIGGLDLALVQAFFQNQFDAGKLIQQDLLSGWHNTLPGGYKFDDAPNLARDVRPVLDKLTPELIGALRNVVPLLLDSDAHAYLSHSALSLIRGDVGGDVRRQALESLQAK